MRKFIIVMAIVLAMVLAVTLVACDDASSANKPKQERPVSTRPGTEEEVQSDANGRVKTTFKFTNGTYEGEVLASSLNNGGVPVFDGEGTLTYADGAQYVGSWSNGKKTEGKQTYANGDVYEGNWLNDLFHGNGKFTWANGNYYDGTWASNRRSGEGTFYFSTGDVETYTGTVVADEMSGECTIKYRNGNVYTGHAEKGKRSGQGSMTYAEGGNYSGGWKEDKEDGKGTLTYANGDTKSGVFVEGALSGECTYTYTQEGAKYQYVGTLSASGAKDGQGALHLYNEVSEKYDLLVFDGVWRNNEYVSGEGTYTFPNGFYSGSWAGGEPSGTGLFVYTDGQYNGEWKRGMKDGQGTYTWNNGNVFTGIYSMDDYVSGTYTYSVDTVKYQYVGAFKNNKKDGAGKLSRYNATTEAFDDVVFDGTWIADAYDSGDGTYVYDDGVYTGGWADGVRSGEGTYTWNNGNVFVGTFADDALVQGRFTYLYDGVQYQYTGAYVGGKKEGEGVLARYNAATEAFDEVIYTGTWVADVYQTGTGSRVYADGVYVGGWVNGVRSGEGTYTWTNGNVFVGTFVADAISQGVLTFDDAEYQYNGAFSGGLKHGNGTLTQYNASTKLYDLTIYTGMWENDNYKDGQGILRYEGGDYYDGAIANGQRHGLGTYYYASGERYEGNWVIDQKSGAGKYYYLSGAYYDGNWADNVKSGAGTIYYDANTTFVGIFSDDESVSGTYTYLVGTTKYQYTGVFVGGKKDGAGRLYTYNTTTEEYDVLMYDGNWKQDQRDGQGTSYNEGGETFVGTWATDKMVRGTYTYASGDVFVGSFDTNGNISNGRYTYVGGEVYDGTFDADGNKVSGTYTYDNGDVYTGTFNADGNKVSGTYTYASGDVYTGAFADEKKSGHGLMLYANGDNYVGAWENDMFNGYGEYTYETDDKYLYTGNFVDNHKQGEGQLYRYNSTTEVYDVELFDGTWNADNYGTGTGILYAGNGDWYRGAFVDGARHGSGYYYYSDNEEYYDGNWVSGAKSGFGEYHYQSGDVFSGTWAADKRVSGTYTYANGDVYVGKFDANGVMKDDTDARYTYVDGDDHYQYAGSIQADKKDGQGSLKRYNAETGDYDILVFNGTWENDKMKFGSYFYDTGATYYGSFDANERIVNGLYTYVNGDCYQGDFDTDGNRSGQGTMLYANGDRYVGAWANNMFHGDGEWIYTKDDVQLRFVGTFNAGAAGDGQWYQRTDSSQEWQETTNP